MDAIREISREITTEDTKSAEKVLHEFKNVLKNEMKPATINGISLSDIKKSVQEDNKRLKRINDWLKEFMPKLKDLGVRIIDKDDWKTACKNYSLSRFGEREYLSATGIRYVRHENERNEWVAGSIESDTHNELDQMPTEIYDRLGNCMQLGAFENYDIYERNEHPDPILIAQKDGVPYVFLLGKWGDDIPADEVFGDAVPSKSLWKRITSIF